MKKLLALFDGAISAYDSLRDKYAEAAAAA